MPAAAFTANPESPRTAAEHRAHADIFSPAAAVSGAVASRRGQHQLARSQNASSTAFVSGGRLDTSGHENRVIQSAPQKVFLYGSQRAKTLNVSDGVGAAVHSGALTGREQARAEADDAKPINVGRKPVTARAGWGSHQAHTPTALRVVGGANTVRAHEVDGAPNAHEKQIEAARGMRGGPKMFAQSQRSSLKGPAGLVADELPKQRPHLRQSPTTANKTTDPLAVSGSVSEASERPQPRSRRVPGAPQDHVYRTVHGAPGPALLLASSASSSTATTPASANPAKDGAALDDDDAHVAPHPHALQATRRHRIAGTRLIPSADNLLGAHSRRVLLLHAPPGLQAAGEAEAAAAAIAEDRNARRYGIRPAIAARHAVTLQGVHDGQPARRFKHPRVTGPSSLGVGACLRVCVASRAHADAARRAFIASRAINQPRFLN